MSKTEAETILNYFMNLGARVGSDDLKWLMGGEYKKIFVCERCNVEKSTAVLYAMNTCRQCYYEMRSFIENMK